MSQKRINKMVKQAIQASAEPKYSIFSHLVTPGPGGIMTNITNAIVAGPDSDERNGNLINLRKLEVRATIRKNSSVLASVTRIIVVRANIDTTPVLEDILQSAFDPILAPHSREVKLSKTYTVLCDKTFVNTELTSTIHVDFTCKINKDCSWISPTSTPGTQSIGAIYVLTLSDEDPTTLPVVTWRHCLTYTDV
jgi:hypothetical protein